MTWRSIALGDIADFVNGFAFKPSDWTESGKQIIRIQNLNDATKPYNRTLKSVAKKYHVAPGDLLVSWSASLGVFTWAGSNTALVNQHIFRVVPDINRVNSGYLRHMLEDALIAMQGHLHGATMKHVNRREFLATKIPLPPLPEQKRIAAILDAADALRAKRRETLVQLDALLQSTFLDLFGDPVTNPMGWKTIAFDEAGIFISGGTPSKAREDYWNGSIPWVSPKDMKFRRITDSKDHIAKLALEETNLKLLAPGHLLIVVRGMILAHTFPAAINDIPVTINQDMKGIAPLPEVDVAYFRDCTQLMSRQILAEISTAGHGTKRFDAQAMRKVLVPIPPLDLQRRFATIVEAVEQQKARQRAHLAELDTLFASLQARAFNGEL